jgi:hypothetical protein
MHYLLESIIVGIYTVIIYLCVNIFSIKNINILFFTVGFFKHLFGHLLNLHTYYCNYGDACTNTEYKISNTTYLGLLFEVILEGLAFICVGRLLYLFLHDKTIIIFFLIGFILHTISELLKIHKYFCENRCIPQIINDDINYDY